MKSEVFSFSEAPKEVAALLLAPVVSFVFLFVILNFLPPGLPEWLTITGGILFALVIAIGTLVLYTTYSSTDCVFSFDEKEIHLEILPGNYFYPARKLQYSWENVKNIGISEDKGYQIYRIVFQNPAMSFLLTAKPDSETEAPFQEALQQMILQKNREFSGMIQQKGFFQTKWFLAILVLCTAILGLIDVLVLTDAEMRDEFLNLELLSFHIATITGWAAYGFSPSAEES